MAELKPVGMKKKNTVRIAVVAPRTREDAVVLDANYMILQKLAMSQP